MANRAYLFASDTVEPRTWEELQPEPYYDSRHVIPLAWFFFFQASDICMIDVKGSLGSEWQEVKFASVKSDAVELFKKRLPILIELTGRYSNIFFIESLLHNVDKWPRRYLLMNPVEVVEDDERDAQGFLKIIAAIDANPNHPSAILEAASFCVGDINEADENRRIINIVGATYWP